MDLVQFFQENNEFIENEHLFYEKSYEDMDVNNKNNKVVTKTVKNQLATHNNNTNNNSTKLNNIKSPYNSNIKLKINNNNNNSSGMKSRTNNDNDNNKTNTNHIHVESNNNQESKDENLNNTNRNKKNVELIFNSNSFTDYSSIDCDSLTDSSNKWTQSNTSNDNKNGIKTKSRYNNNDYEYTSRVKNKNDNKAEEIEEDLANENINVDLNNNTNEDDEKDYVDRVVLRPRISRQKQILAEILNNNDDNDDHDYEEIILKQHKPDRPITRRGRGQDFMTESRASQNSDYVKLNECLSVKTPVNQMKQVPDDDIKEELAVEAKTYSNNNISKTVEFVNFEENEAIDEQSLYTPPLPIDDEETLTESDNSNKLSKPSVEYVTVDKIVSPNSRNNNIVNKSLPKISKTQSVNISQTKNLKPQMEVSNNYNNYHNKLQTSNNNTNNNSGFTTPSPYSKFQDFTGGRITSLSQLKDYKLTLARNREKYNVSRNTNKSSESRQTYNSFTTSVSLHTRKMNQYEILQSVNRLCYAPKRNFEHPKFETLHDKFSNVDIDAVSLRLFSSKSNKNKDTQNTKSNPPVKYLNKIEIDKMIERLMPKPTSRVPESCRVIKKTEYKNMGLIQSFAWKGYN